MDNRRIDALVAEKVFQQAKPFYVHSFHINPKQHGVWICAPDYEHGDQCEWYPLRFSTDLAAAFLAVEKMHEMGAHVEISNAFGEPSERWGCFIAHEMDNMAGQCDWGGQAYAETAPLAISLAALKAVGVDTSELEAA